MIYIQRLETILCDTDRSRDQHFEVRYRVFCEQTGFERAGAFPDGREQDRYDAAASHFLVADRLRGGWVGAMRLVHAGSTRLPLEDICQCRIAGLGQDRDRRRAIELSRLSVVSGLRQGFADVIPPVAFGSSGREPSGRSSLSGQERHEILIRMIWAAIQWARENDVEHVYGIVTSALARMLKSLGVPAVPVGDEVQHRGVRRPYRYDVRETAHRMAEALPQAGHIFFDEDPYIPYSALSGSRQQVV